MAHIQIDGLTKWYGKRRGVENVTLDVADQEFLTMFGPAGAGKTTTLNLIAGIVTPNRGSVRIGDRDVDGLEPSDRNVAMVFESYALYPQLTVFDNMAFPLRSPKHRQSEDRVRERVTHYARVMKIDHLLHRPIQALSNGQRQRTALGRALVRQPDLFLLDEPLSHLDAKLRHSMRAELKEMRQQLGTTTIYVTHDYMEAMSLGDRIAVINEGRIQQIGAPDEVYFRPANTQVARLFGDPEINLLKATIKPFRQTQGGSTSEGLQLQILGETRGVQIPDDVAQLIRQKQFTEVLAGVRPTDIRMLGDNSKSALHGVVYSFEPLGTKSILTLDAVDQTKIRALVDGRETFNIDRRVQFTVDPQALIFFDPESQQFFGRSKLAEEEVSRG